MEKEPEKRGIQSIDWHLVIDQQGKVKVTQDLLTAFNIRPGDMLTFHFDTSQENATVTGSRTPPDFHPEIQVNVTLAQQSPNIETQTQSLQSQTVTQPALFDAGQSTSKQVKQRRTR